MSKSKHTNLEIELKSENARRIINEVPSFVIRMGNIAFLIIVTLVIVTSFLIEIEPVIKIDVIIKSSESGLLSGQVLLPKKTIISDSNELPMSLESEYNDLFPNCKINIDSKIIYIRDNQKFWSIPVVFGSQKRNNTILINEDLHISGYIKLKKRSLLKWVYDMLFERKTINI